MVKFLKPQKVVILLNGRYAGRKGVIIKNFDDGVNGRQYGHALVAGIDKYPLKVTKSMGKKRLEKRSRIKPFVKIVNYQHMMPTRYGMDIDLKEVNKAMEDTPNDISKARIEARKSIRKSFMSRNSEGKNRWFFTKLRF
eukprot:c52623_g1_i1.p1 GENE.c52623_g1_i1~~c52623_g1_i1.p1  ORF type:complete len:151 (+),score=7.34 c52623_g1_i1:39-455(+)